MVALSESKQSKRMLVLAGAAMAWGATYSLPQVSQAGVIFQDTFSNGSTLQGSNFTPTANSTNYDVASGKNSTDAIAANKLSMVAPASTSVTTEAEGVFTATPYALNSNNVGDFIDMQVVFTDGAGLINSASTTTSFLGFGLYSSGGTGPVNTLSQTGLGGSTNSPGSSGGVAGWTGYLSDIQAANSGTHSKLITRPAQTSSSTNNAQDLIGNGASSSQNFKSPAGTTLTSGGSGTGTNLTAGSQYTEDFEIQTTAAGTYTVTSNLYSGVGTGGTLLAGNTGTDSTFLYTNFDSFGIGWLDKSDIASTEMDINEITITTPTVAVPEPVSLGVIGVSGLALMLRRRRKA